MRVRLKEQVVHREVAWGPELPLASLRMSGYQVSNIAHNSDIYIGNMQLKKKEILHGRGAGLAETKVYGDCII